MRHEKAAVCSGYNCHEQMFFLGYLQGCVHSSDLHSGASTVPGVSVESQHLYAYLLFLYIPGSYSIISVKEKGSILLVWIWIRAWTILYIAPRKEQQAIGNGSEIFYTPPLPSRDLQFICFIQVAHSLGMSCQP